MSTTSSIKPRFAEGVSQPQNGLELKEVLTEEVFRRMISLERKRSERTQRRPALRAQLFSLARSEDSLADSKGSDER